MTNYHKLSDRIAAKKYSMVKTLLSEDKSLDLTYQSGRFFKLSIKSNSYDITKVLLDYFEENQLSKYDITSEEYTELRNQLKIILEDIIEEEDISSQMKKVLSAYIDLESSIDSRLEEDFSEIEDIDYKSWLEQMKKENEGSQSTADYNNSPQKEEILKDIINNSFSGELLTSHNIQLLGQEGIVEAKDQVVIEDIKDHQI